MPNKRLIFVCLPLVLALRVCGAGIATDSGVVRAAEPHSLSESSDETEAALAFINGYVAYCLESESGADVVRWVGATPLATAGFKRELRRMMDKAWEEDPELGLGFDPLFNAQDFPDGGFELAAYYLESGRLIVRGKDWPEFLLAMHLVNEQGKWLVDGCGAVNIPAEMRP